MATRPAPTGTLSLRTALDRSAPLGQLLRQLQASRECLAAVQPLLPPGLREQVQAGPLDEQGWTLLVPSGAAGSKLRQLLPTLEQTLHDRGGQGTPIRIRVQPRGATKP